MQIDKIIESISSDAQKKASEIEQESKLKCEQIIETAKKSADEDGEKTLSLGKEKAMNEQKRRLSVYSLELEKNVLKTKREMLACAYEGCKNKILNMPKDEYLRVAFKLFSKIQISGEEQILVSPNEKYLDSDFLKTIHPNLKLVKNEKVTNGFIVSKGGMFIDAKFDTVIAELQTETETDIAKILLREE